MKPHPSIRFGQRLVSRLSPEAAALVEFGNRRRWKSQVLGRAEIPNQPVFIGQWWLVPVEQDKSAIPKRACERVRTLYEAGLRPRGFVLAHEAPALLPPPDNTQPESRKPLIDLSQLLSRRVILVLGGTLMLVLLGPMLLKVLVAVVAGIMTIVFAPLLALGAIGAVALVDPVLIAVTEDGYWVEIDRWMS